jgi:hypothetical protein
MSYHYITSPRRVPCMGMHVSLFASSDVLLGPGRRGNGCLTTPLFDGSHRHVVLWWSWMRPHCTTREPTGAAGGTGRRSWRSRHEELEDQTEQEEQTGGAAEQDRSSRQEEHEHRGARAPRSREGDRRTDSRQEEQPEGKWTGGAAIAVLGPQVQRIDCGRRAEGLRGSEAVRRSQRVRGGRRVSQVSRSFRGPRRPPRVSEGFKGLKRTS